MFKQLTSAFFCLFLATQLFATHNYSGEIFFQKNGGLVLTATIITYTNAASVLADRDTLTLDWGDGYQEKVVRYNGSGNGELITANIKKNFYTGQHTYAVPGIYWLSMTDPNRSAGILNINPPYSDNVPFHLEAMVRLLPDAAGSVYSPFFLELPVDEGLLQAPFQHVPNAFDADGDSLAYALAVPLQGPGVPVPNYFWPNEIAAGPGNEIALDPVTGKFTWETPQAEGAYCISIVVRAYRNGLLVEETRRDMLIEISPGFNSPPVASLTSSFPPADVVDVAVGESVQIQVTGYDQDFGQNLTLTATGGLFENFFQEKATFNAVANTGVFNWTAQSEHVRQQPYQIVFKAKDNFQNEGLATFRVVRFRVNGVSGLSGANPGLPALRLFPNPSPGALRVELPAGLSAGATLRIVDAQAKILHEQSVPAGSTTQTVETSDLPAGAYFLQIIRAGKVLTVNKWIKL